MPSIIRISASVLLFIFMFNKSFSQSESETSGWLSKHPLEISFGNALVAMPFTNISMQPFYPVLTSGTEFYYKQKDNSDFFQTAKINYYYAKYSTSALVINSEIGYRYIFKCGLYGEGAVGIGYSHLFRPNAIYKLNKDNKYEQVRDWGTPSFMADFAFSVGYKFLVKDQYPINVFLKYGSYVDILYAPDIPALPYNIIQIGSRFFITRKSNSDEK